jgi:hypothetical protein
LGNEPYKFSLDAEIYGPGFNERNKQMGICSNLVYIKANFVDIDSKLGLVWNGQYYFLGNLLALKVTITSVSTLQLGAKCGFTVARNLFENDKHKFNGG